MSTQTTSTTSSLSDSSESEQSSSSSSCTLSNGSICSTSTDWRRVKSSWQGPFFIQVVPIQSSWHLNLLRLLCFNFQFWICTYLFSFLRIILKTFLFSVASFSSSIVYAVVSDGLLQYYDTRKQVKTMKTSFRIWINWY